MPTALGGGGYLSGQARSFSGASTRLPSTRHATLFKLPCYTATRYVQPLREGGSLPAVVDTHGGGLFVTKFRGAGQGVKSLIAELIVGALAHAAKLPAPQLALIAIPSSFGRSEPDPEIQDLLRASHGINVGLRYLDGAFNFDPLAAGALVTPSLLHASSGWTRS